MTKSRTDAEGVMTIEFEVLGKPVTQGSTRTIPLRQKGGGYRTRPDGRPMLVPTHDNAAKLKAWRQEVASVARQVYVELHGTAAPPLLTGPLRLTLEFYRPRPKGHYGTGRNARLLKPSAPEYPTPKPDTVKLARAVEDSLTGVVWADDSQVVDHVLRKRYGEFFRVSVRIEVLKEASQ